VRVAGAEEMTRTLREIAEIAYGEPARLPPDMEPGLEAQYRYNAPPVTWTSAAHACIVEVDAETGFVTIKRWVCSEDCGVVINPAIVEGQIAGGLAQGIGQVLLEEMHFDAQGNPTAATFKDYLMPAAVDVPEFEFTHIVTPSAAEGGFRGVGEGGAIIGPPTLCNAIADALAPFGALPLELPLTPSKILKLMEGGPQARPEGAPMPSQPPRVPPIPVDQLTEEQAALVGPYAGLNFSRVMVRHPDLYRAFMPFGEQLMARTSLPPRDRQILIVRTCALCSEDYETGHHVNIARNVGLTDAEIDAARTGGPGLPASDEVLLRLAEELVRDHCVGDETWARLAQRYEIPQAMEAVILVGDYVMLSMVTRSFGIQFEGPPQTA
jgi:alkylhydroperoxidase/carboxymuconolactone decarboxylase family protein YurZ